MLQIKQSQGDTLADTVRMDDMEWMRSVLLLSITGTTNVSSCFTVKITVVCVSVFLQLRNERETKRR